MCDTITFTSTDAILTLVNIDLPSETLTFASPMRDLELKGANAVQLLGGAETYQRRYLYMAMLDIVESDQFDDLPPDTTAKPKPNTKPETSSFADEVREIVGSLATSDERKAAGEIVKSLNNGSAEFWTITDKNIQNKIITALKEKYHV